MLFPTSSTEQLGLDSANEMQKFEDKQKADIDRYIEEHKTVYGKEPPSVAEKLA